MTLTTNWRGQFLKSFIKTCQNLGSLFPYLTENFEIPVPVIDPNFFNSKFLFRLLRKICVTMLADAINSWIWDNPRTLAEKKIVLMSFSLGGSIEKPYYFA